MDEPRATRSSPAARSQEPQPPAFVHRFVLGACAAVLLICAFAAGTWLLGAPILTSIPRGAPPMGFNTMSIVALLAAALWLLSPEHVPPWRRRFAQALALCAIGLGVLTLCEYAFQWNPGYDRLFVDPTVPGLMSPDPGRPSPQTAVTACLLGSALLLLDRRPIRGRRPSDWLLLSGLLLPYLGFIGFTLEFRPVFSITPHTGMAFLTVVTMSLVGIAALFARPRRGVARHLLMDDTGGRLLRAMLPVAIVAPLLIGWLRAMAQEAHLIGHATGIALMVLTESLIAVGLIAWNTRTIRRAEARQDRMVATLKEQGKALSDALCEAQDLYENAPCGYHSIDANGVIVRVNATALRWLGYERDEVIQRMRITDLFSPSSLALFRATFPSFTEGVEAQNLEFEFRCKDGHFLPVLLSATALRDAGGHFVLSRSTFVDITERRKAEAILNRLQVLEDLNRLKDRFLSTISHEMRTPLSLIVGYTELLEDQCKAPRLIEGIKEGTQRFTRQLDSILDYNALLSEALPLFLGEIDMAEVLDHASLIAEPELAAKGLGFERAIAPGVPHVHGDFKRLVQIVRELLENARKFSASGGTVGIRLLSREGNALIQVWDTGPGIAPEALERIWEAFTQIQEKDSERHGGLGLGLCIARKLAELHGGSLTVESEVGSGSTFTLCLPPLSVG